MKTFSLVLLFVIAAVVNSNAQDMSKFSLYKPTEDASAGLAAAVKKAKEEKKQVFVQIGGNWCVWCARYNDFTTKNTKIDSLMKADFVVYHLNYSKENKNEQLLAKYQFPQRFGFPVFLVLDEKGNLLHTQNSAYLEEGKGYSEEKILGFLGDWTRKALDPSTYAEKPATK